MRKTNLMVASFAAYVYLVGAASMASEIESTSNTASNYIAQAAPTDYYPPADPTMPPQPYSLPGQTASPDLRPGYPSTSYPGGPVNGAPQVSVGHHHHQHTNKQHKHSHKIHVMRAVKHVVGFSAKAPFAIVP